VQRSCGQIGTKAVGYDICAFQQLKGILYAVAPTEKPGYQLKGRYVVHTVHRMSIDRVLRKIQRRRGKTALVYSVVKKRDTVPDVGCAYHSKMVDGAPFVKKIKGKGSRRDDRRLAVRAFKVKGPAEKMA
jgi:hypothetical protein